jgi:hypothetical protein
LRAADLVLSLPWLDDEQATLQFGTTRVFTLIGGIAVEIQATERRHECQLMSSSKIQKIMRKTRRSKRRNVEGCVINVTPYAKQPAEFQT